MTKSDTVFAFFRVTKTMLLSGNFDKMFWLRLHIFYPHFISPFLTIYIPICYVICAIKKKIAYKSCGKVQSICLLMMALMQKSNIIINS